MDDHSYANPPQKIDIYEEMEEVGDFETSDELLISCVNGYPQLYDKSSRHFKDATMKDNSWMEISKSLNIPGEKYIFIYCISFLKCTIIGLIASECRIRWKRLRERYGKEKRLRDLETRSGSGASTRRSTFLLFNNMLFLDKHMLRRK